MTVYLLAHRETSGKVLLAAEGEGKGEREGVRDREKESKGGRG